MRTFTLFWILLAAAPLMAQEPNGVALPENPGGVDMRLPDSVRGRLEEAQKERAALEQADPPASPNLVSLINRQIEQLERHLALLDEIKRWEAFRASLASETIKAKAEVDAATAALAGMDEEGEMRKLQRLATAQQIQDTVNERFRPELDEARKEVARLAEALRTRTVAQGQLAKEIEENEKARLEHLRMIGEIQAASDKRESLPDAEYNLLQRRLRVRQQGAVHTIMRAAAFLQRGPDLASEIELVRLQSDAATLRFERAKRLAEAAQSLVDARLAKEKRAATGAIQRKEEELRRATERHDQLRLTEELENERLSAAEKETRQELADHSRQGGELDALVADEIAGERGWRSLYVNGEGDPPTSVAVAQEIRRLERATERSAFQRAMDSFTSEERRNKADRERIGSRREESGTRLRALEAEAQLAFAAAGRGDATSPEWRLEHARWQSLAEERKLLLDRHADALLKLAEVQGANAERTDLLQETQRRTLFLLRRENLFLRSESHLSWEAMQKGFGDVATLPRLLAGYAAAIAGYVTSPTYFLPAVTHLGGVLLLGLLLLWLGRAVRSRLQALEERRGDAEMAGALSALGRFLRTFLLALLLFLALYTAPLFLPDLPVGVSNLLEAFGWLLGGFWLVRGLSRLLLGSGARPGLLLRNEQQAAVRLRGAVRLLLLASVVLLPIHQALLHLAYPNEGFTEALLLAYKVLIGLVLVTMLLRRSLLLRLVDQTGGRAGRFLRLLVVILQPVAVLLVPTLLLLDAFRYDILAGLIASFSVIMVAVTLVAGLLYRLTMLLLESRLGRPPTPERESKSKDTESAVSVAQFCLKVCFLLAGAWAVLALSGTGLDEVRDLVDHPLPFVGPDAEHPVTWWNVGVALLLLYFFIYLTRTVKTALQDLILPRTGMDKGLQYTITTLAGYVLLAVGIYLATREVFDLTSLGYIVAALSVGIGFGLQEIVSNFISGIILLFERPLRVGDMVKVGDTEGIVRRINIRATTVQTQDNVYMLVPNREFISQSVINYGYTDPKVRMHIPFGVAYGSDVAEVRDVALEVAKSHRRVLERPAPDVRFVRFGDSSLDFELLPWVGDPADRPRIMSDLYFALHAALLRHGIEIPFPQRDLHLRSAEPLRMDRGDPVERSDPSPE